MQGEKKKKGKEKGKEKEKGKRKKKKEKDCGNNHTFFTTFNKSCFFIFKT